MSEQTRPGIAPLVHVVVVDYNGGDLTRECIRSIHASAWPADRLRVVLVDNASATPVTPQIVDEWPAVEVITSPTNLGFAGGVNLGLRKRADADFVALVNNDATVAPDWLTPLVSALEADPALGAACPKIRFATPAVELSITAPTSTRGRGDGRALGVRVSGARVDGADVWDRVQLVDGFWGDEPMPTGESGGQWTMATARLRVPAATRPGTVGLRLAVDRPTTVTVISGADTTALAVGTDATWFDVPVATDPVEVINNVGNVIGSDGYGADRGWLEVDHGQFDTATDVAGWCGAAVVMSRAYLDDVGELDERLFLYYEDVELSQRGRARGWRYRYVPESVVRHVHSATSVAGSPFAFHYNERNRLLVLSEQAAPADVVRAFGRYLAITASYAIRDIASPALRGERPRPEIVGRRLRAVGSAAVRVPQMRRDRPATPPTPPPAH